MPTPVTRPRVNASYRSYGERIGLDAGSVGGAADQVAEQAPLIANCAGWGARELVPDPCPRHVCGGSDGNRSPVLVLLPASARQASDPGGEAPHHRYPTYDQDDPRGRGDGEGKYD